MNSKNIIITGVSILLILVAGVAIVTLQRKSNSNKRSTSEQTASTTTITQIDASQQTNMTSGTGTANAQTTQQSQNNTQSAQENSTSTTTVIQGNFYGKILAQDSDTTGQSGIRYRVATYPDLTAALYYNLSESEGVVIVNDLIPTSTYQPSIGRRYNFHATYNTQYHWYDFSDVDVLLNSGIDR